MGKLTPILMLFGSNLFMVYAWYGHLKDMKNKALWLVILLSWGVAFFEYCLQVPANRIGQASYTLAQLKVLQEIITMLRGMGIDYAQGYGISEPKRVLMSSVVNG